MNANGPASTGSSSTSKSPPVLLAFQSRTRGGKRKRFQEVGPTA